MTRPRVVRRLAVLSVALAWIATGGFVRHSYWLNPFDVFDREPRFTVMAEATAGDRWIGVPLAYVLVSDGPPFGLQLTLSTEAAIEDPALELDRVEVQLADGALLDLTEKCRPEMKLQRAEYSLRGRQRKSLHARCAVADCFSRQQPLTVRIRGRLLSRRAELHRIDAELRIPLRVESNLYLGWQWLIQLQR